MKKIIAILVSFSMLLLLTGTVNLDVAFAQTVNKIKQGYANHDPFGVPRPGNNMTNVPLKTSFYTTLYVEGDASDSIDFDSIEVQLIPENGDPFYILSKNQVFSEGYSGIIENKNIGSHGAGTAIYIDSKKELKPNTTYTVKINAVSKKGYGIAESDGTWSFTTAPKAELYQLNASLDFNKEPDVKWHGRYFNGILRPDFDTFEVLGTDRFDYIYSDAIKEKYPEAWNIFRDFSITDDDYYDTRMLQPFQANAVREKETRHIVSIEEKEEGILLHVEDFFGHEQYGIESNRPLSSDYKAGDEILIADGINHRRANVISTDDSKNTVLVTRFTMPSGGFNLDYLSPLPEKENPASPGLFPKGGTYLYKFNPVGTPVYYWGRVDHEYDRLHFDYKVERIAINFNQAPGDLSIDGGSWTTAKDFVQLHKVTYDITCHLIDRYGDATLNWIWSVMNEPDLYTAFWRVADWIELQRFYDYTSDAILKAFEDKGYDSNKVLIGGLELGAIFGTVLRIQDFLAHCSPTARKHSANTLDYNAAYADPRLDGKRSRRVEELCSANNGKGAPLDFVSIHSYNSSEVGAAKIIRAKEIALEIDPDYYSDLWVSNFESVPTWSDFSDPGGSHWAIGNGYFPTWAADYFGRLLQKAKADPRYSYGEGVITTWGYAQNNFKPFNDVVTIVNVREGRQIRKEVIPKPIFHYVNLLSTMKTDYWVLPQEKIAGHTVSGFAAPGEDDLRIALYSHDRYDPQSRAHYNFKYNLSLNGIPWDKVKVTEYQLDKENNSIYPFAVENISKTSISEKQFETLKELSELKATNERIYEVNSGGLKISFPLAANGVNFIVLSEATEETPAETPNETPAETPGETPAETPSETPGVTPGESPIETPDETPLETQTETPGQQDETKKPSDKDDSSPSTNDAGVTAVILLLLLSTLGIIFAVVNKNKLTPYNGK